MCHSSLTLNFDVNKYNCSYIIGPNGSGKSALFAALNIGLGGAGRSNERGKRINDYIKENENYSLIRIHISNEGPNSIPDYGDIIIVERRITHKISTVTIKTRLNEGKEEIVGKRRELDLILQQFNIDLENPLSWLSQDRARQFLQSMKPQRLYELYKKSSEMDGAEDLFRNIDTLFDELTRVVKSMDKEKTAKEAKYQQMKARFDAVNQLSNKKEAIQRLYWYQLWAPVRDGKNEIEELGRKLKVNEDKKNEQVAKKDELIKQIGDINKQQKNFEEQLGAASSKFREHNEKLNELKRKARELNFDHHDLVDKVKRKQWNIDLYERQLQKANRELKDLVGSSGHDPETEKNKLKEKLTQIAAQMEAAESEQESFTNELSSIKVEYENLKKEFKENTDQHSLLERRRTRIIEEKTLFEQSKADKLAIFGKDVPRLLELIDTNIHSFKKRPIGPIGNYIKLKDKKWANPIEFCLKNMIGTFLCDSSEDRKALDEICKTLQIRKPNVITTEFADQKYDLFGREPPNEFTTILRVLDVENPTVLNYILDKVRAESVLLFEKDDVARNAMYPKPPKNASKAITLACSEVNPQRGSRPYQFFRDHSNFQARVLDNHFMASNLNDFNQQLEQSTEQLRQQSEKVEKSKRFFQTLEFKLNNLRQKKTQTEARLNGLNERKYEIEEELSKLEDEVLSEDKITNLRSSIRESEDERNALQVKLTELEQSLAEKTEKMNEAENKIEASTKRADHLKNDYKQIENDIKSCQIQIEKNREKLEDCEGLTKRANDLIVKYRKQIEDKTKSCEKKREEAEKNRDYLLENHAEIGDGVPDFDTIPETVQLNRDIEAIQNEIRNAEKNKEPVPTEADLINYKNIYIEFKAKLKVWTRRYNMLESMITARKRRFDLIRTSLPGKLECWFRDHMNYRGYKASLDVRDDDGTIMIKVVTHKAMEESFAEQSLDERDSRMQKKVLQDLKGLSGGERSYTTACFIMSLWKCMESPFRCMDEFDVFMDMVNRRYIMEMLADMAKDSKEVQFFFFTPQPIQELKRDMFEVFTLKRIAGIFNEEQQQQENQE
ncbi:unnamed protein product [Meloidogyne enterolobii]|uniref:Uncharacterized protein n=1 Tax=Meloidogyne enterolobii TaxID=390850 RepID=A0ACB0ZUY7_MELEN